MDTPTSAAHNNNFRITSSSNFCSYATPPPRTWPTYFFPSFFGFHSRASRCASAIWSGVIYMAAMSRFLTASSRSLPGGMRETARLDHTVRHQMI